KLFTAILETGGQIHHQAADAKVRRRQPPTRRRFNQVQDLFAFAEAVEEDSHRADIERVSSEPNEMRGDALQFAKQHADHLSAFGNLEAEQLLTGHHVGEVVAEWIQIIHAVSDHDPLLVLFVLKQLLHSRVEIADIRRGLHNHLTVKHEFETQHAVRRRVLRTHRNRHLCIERTIDDLKLWSNGCGTHLFLVLCTLFFVLWTPN